MKTIAFCISLLCAIPMTAQSSFDNVLRQVEENNLTLKARHQETEVEKLDNRAENYLENPEVEFGYLWGDPGEIGTRKDFAISQSIDFPTLSGMKRRAAKTKDRLSDLQYQADRINLLLQAKQYCIDLIYYNRMDRELRKRLNHALSLARQGKQSLEEGNSTAIDLSKAELNAATLQGLIARNELERSTILSALRSLNGGIDIALPDTVYPPATLPADFSQWYASCEAKSPILSYMNQQIEVGKKEVGLSKAQTLPSLSAGYMQESVVGESYRGISIGLSIPLWSNRNRIRKAKQTLRAAEARQAESKQSFYDTQRNLYIQTEGLRKTAEAYAGALRTSDQTHLLRKALDAGQISLTQYLTEIAFYYDATDQAITAERDYQRSLAELSALDL